MADSGVPTNQISVALHLHSNELITSTSVAPKKKILSSPILQTDFFAKYILQYEPCINVMPVCIKPINVLQ